VENKTNFTWVEIVSRRLNDKGKPSSDDDWSGGRFIAQFDGFVDPTIYTSGKLITVVGPITGFTTREIGAFTYQYPIVEVDTSYLWPPAPDPIYYPPPYWYYDPWYPYYYPYHRYPPYWY
jgi:outer membrane lipoprotein